MKNTVQQVDINSLQQFGNLIITDNKMVMVAISDSAQSFTNIAIQQLLGLPLTDFLHHLWGSNHQKFLATVQALIAKQIPSQVFSKKIKSQYYYFKLNLNKGFVYIEWEEQHRKHISVSRMNELGFLFDEIYVNNWNFLCKALQKILKFERVFVLQIQETGQSSIIAESLKADKPSFCGKEFAQSFFPPELTPYYNSLAYRYIPNLDKLDQKLYSLDPGIHLLCSQLAVPPELHEIYLRSIGVKAALFFPLYLEGNFWGLVVAQHPKAKKIDLQQRKLCIFIIQSAMSKFENLFKQGLIDENQQLSEAELILKHSLADNKTVNCALVQNMELLTNMVKADGFGIYNQGDVFFHGDVPHTDLFYDIVDYLKIASNKTLFKDYNFKLNHGSHFQEELPFAGLLYYTLGIEKDYYLIWFRKEHNSKIVQLNLDKQKNGTQIRTWEQPIYDSALPWDDSDLRFITMLQQTIKESIVIRSAEKQMLTNELQLLNNELEMFTFSLSHDLKNPLSILKMGLQFLKSVGHTLSLEKKNDWFQNLSGSVTNIEDIIDNIVLISQSKTTAMAKDPIPMSYTIKKISQEAKLIHQAPDCQMDFGKLLPLWGEKSALYQVFLNIINNAVKYSSKNPLPKVCIHSTMDEHLVCYSIQDNGVGIPKENLPHVFDIFIRAGNSQSFQGTGVGLSLVKRIMDRLGGTIEIQSIEGTGTTVNLIFPISSPFPDSML
ncbi:ATP-binding protein [Sphingobacterium paucimobilis]|uniref:histidine kinase n=1 Tax=Sphingobacterium paucimobilis HER1398 TaxID=1346330 RepID=U2J3Q9_9SPHI|nr:ATP-binding protein [Sphingobacterium paucimobilis]ERJ57283.1 hypothetical protein M472_00740 [Sphingobacterium paucimobilis HER1398]